MLVHSNNSANPADNERYAHNERYAQTLAWIHGIGRFGMKPGLERVAALLARLGNPHHSLRFLHVAGTNGKGSTAVMAASILEAAGYRTGLYTSPYLAAFTNRMAVSGRDIVPAELVRLAERVRPLVEKMAGEPELGQPTEFEVVTVLAMLYFAEQAPDLVVLEVGLGGRLDATNVVQPDACIITNISLEHTAVLGNTVEAIAREKAGIIKPGAPVVTAAADPAALAVIAAVSRERGVPCYRTAAQGPVSGTGSAPATDPPPPGACRGGSASYFPAPPDACWAGLTGYSERAVVPEGQHFTYRGLNRRLERLFVPMFGEYQCLNAATALTALELLEERGFPLTAEAVRSGLAAVRWPGRLEIMGRDPLLVLDGAHNPAAVRELARAVPEHFPGRPLVLVLGILADKDRAAMLRDLLPLAARVVATEPDIPRACPADQLAEEVRRRFAGPVTVHRSVPAALRAAVFTASPDDLVLVTGSLYTVSEARAYLQS